MKNLTTLIKLQKSKVDEQRLILKALEDKLAQVNLRIKALDKQKQEQEDLLHAQPELGMTYADYINQYLSQRDALEKEKDAVAYGVQLALDKLAELFEEQKRYEIAKQNRLDEMARERLRAEMHEMDEVGSVRYERRNREARKRS